MINVQNKHPLQIHHYLSNESVTLTEHKRRNTLAFKTNLVLISEQY